MSNMTPGLNLKVENTLKGDGSEMAVDLKFSSMDDFNPANIVDQVDPLKKLLDTRNKLNDLLAKADRSEDLEGIVERVLKDSGDLEALKSDLGIEDAGGGEEGGE